MKLTLKSTINTTNPLFTLFEQNKYAFPLGRNICVKHLSQDNYMFLPLWETVEEVLDLCPTSNRRHFLVAELQQNGDVGLATYAVKGGERKSTKVATQPYKRVEIVQTAESSVGAVWVEMAGEGHMVVLVDLAKMKVLATGFYGEQVICVKSHPANVNIVTISTKTFVKNLEAKDGGFELSNQLFRKFIVGKELAGHLWMDSDTLIVHTQTEILALSLERSDLLQSLNIDGSVGQSITHIKRLGRCLLVSTSIGRGLLYLRTEQKFVIYQQCWISQGNKLLALDVNSNEDLVIARLPDLTFVSSKVDDISEEKVSGHYKPALNFEVTETNIGELDYQGVSICQTKPLVLFVQKKTNSVGIFNMDSHKCVIKKQFVVKYKEDNANILMAGAMHPNGYSLALAFVDRIRLYHLLLDDIKCFHELANKRVRKLRYSHGGQFLCFSYGKGKGTAVSVLNTINMQQICSLKIGSDVDMMIWSENDYELICACQGYIYKWTIVDGFTNRVDIPIGDKVSHMRFDFKTDRLVVSTPTGIVQVQGNTNVRKIPAPIPNFDFVYPLDGKYLFGDTTGYLYVSPNIEAEKTDRLAVGLSKGHLFSKAGTLMHLSEDHSEVYILRTKASHETIVQKDEYILVARNQLERNIQKLHNLQSNIEVYHSQLATKLFQQKASFQNQLKSDLSKLKLDLLQARNNYTTILSQKTQLEKMSAHLFESVQQGQVRAVEALQKLYEGKLSIERGRVLTLEQKLLEDKVVFERQLKELEYKHHTEIEEIRNRYEDNFKMAFTERAGQKNKEMEFRKEYESRFMEIQEENELMVVELQLEAASENRQLIRRISLIEKDFDTAKANNQNLKDRAEELAQKHKQQTAILTKTQVKLEESQNRSACLQREVKAKEELIREKEQRLSQYEFRINELEKSKHVLSFRTTEIRKELEPKQAQIEKLRKQQLKLEEQFSLAMKQNYACLQKLQRSEKDADNTRKQLAEIKTKLKKKTMIYQQLTQDIYRLVNNLDPKEWNPRIVEIYQRYVSNTQQDLRKKPNENTAEEMNRHLIHLEKSLHQVGQSNDRAVKGCEKQIVRRLKENAQLITDLNNLRNQHRQLKLKHKLEIQAKNNQLLKLQKQLTDVARSTHRIDSALTGVTGPRRTTKNQQDSLDTSFRMGADYRKSQYTVNTQPRSRHSNRILSANRTAVCRGNNYDPNSVSVMERNKLYNVMMELQAAQSRIKQQDKIIDELNRRAISFE